jgi:hypothetical protein
MSSPIIICCCIIVVAAIVTLVGAVRDHIQLSKKEKFKRSQIEDLKTYKEDGKIYCYEDQEDNPFLTFSYVWKIREIKVSDENEKWVKYNSGQLFEDGMILWSGNDRFNLDSQSAKDFLAIRKEYKESNDGNTEA